MDNLGISRKFENGSTDKTKTQLVKEICDYRSRQGKPASRGLIHEVMKKNTDLGETAIQTAINKTKERGDIQEINVSGIQAKLYFSTDYTDYINEDAPERPEIHSEIYKAFSQVEQLTDSRTATSEEILEIAGLENVGERAEAAFDAVASELNWQSPSKAELEERNRELIQMGVAYSLRWFKFNQTDQLSFPEKLVFLTDSPDISSEVIDFDEGILKEKDKTVLENEFRWKLYADESPPHIKLIFDGVSGYLKSAEHIKLEGAKVGFDGIGYSDHGM
jgi:hypothetical protein